MIIDLKTIKKIYINLDSKISKRKQTEKLFKDLKYTNVERFCAINDKSYYSSGCSLSHRQTLKNYYDHSPILILEDDNYICDWYSEYIPKNGLIDILDDCDMFYLGYSISEGEQPSGKRPLNFSFVNDKIIKLKGSLCAHAIIFISEKAKKEAIISIDKSIEKKVPGDVGYYDMMHNLNVYAFTSAVFYQSGFNCTWTNIRIFKNNNEVYYNSYHELNKNVVLYSDKLLHNIL